MIKGFICGVFDLFHIGHVIAFKDCKNYCNHLTVGLNSAENVDLQINPNKETPVFSVNQRVEILTQCKLVDEILVYNCESELAKVMSNGNFDIRFLGADYKGRPITGENLTKRLFYLDRSHGFSTLYFKKLIRNHQHSA